MKKVLVSLVTTVALCIPFALLPTTASGQKLKGNRPSDEAAAAALPDAAPGEYFVAFRDELTADDIALVQSLASGVGKKFSEARALAFKAKSQRHLDALAKNPRVEFVEPVPMRYKMDLSNQQLAPTMSNGLYGLLTTKSTTVHSRNVLGAGINVGVADTSLDYNHPDIQANYRGGIDTVNNDNDPINNDGETHGTHVAGTILGVNNSAGVYGVAYAANLYHARVLGPNGGTSADIMDGVRWLVETANCKIINLSLGGGLRSRTEERFYNDMRKKEVLIVAATGNDGATRISYPAGYAANIAVGAVDRNNVVASFSNRGTNIDVVAPGVGVLSSVPRGQGSEASVSTTSTLDAHGFEFAGKTNGTTGTLVDCKLGQPADFTTINVVGKIALIQRGTISFADKVTNAMNAGAIAAIIYNNVAGDLGGTLGAATTADGRTWIPTVGVSETAGATLKSQVGTSATVVDKVSSWDTYDGTSMATPHTAGVLALIWSANQSLPYTTIESYLFTTCRDLGAAGYDTTYGRGIVDADAAVARVGR